MTKKLLLLSFSIFIYSIVISQNSNVGFRVKYLEGINVIPTGVTGFENENILGNSASGFEIGIVKQSEAKKDWEKLFGSPRLSLCFSKISFSENKIFGDVFTLIPGFETDILKLKNNFLSTKFGMGASYNTEVYNKESNRINRNASNFNFAFQIEISWQKKIKPNLLFSIDFGFLHCSNGSFKIPNDGLNIAFVKAGINYYLKSYQINTTKISLKSEKSNWYYQTFLAYGFKEQGLTGPHKYSTITYNHQLLKPINKILDAGIILDLFYDATPYIRRFLPANLNEISETEKNHAAIGFGSELKIGNFSLPLHIMHYFFNLNTINKEKMYTRFGAKYMLNNNIFISATFKGTITNTSIIQSDFMEWGVGIKL